MHSYAQTNIQLFNQLRHNGYSGSELESIFNAYELAMRLFAGQFRGSGKMFIAHLVGNASILGSLHVPVTVVVAGLLHATYTHGDFGDGRKGISNAKRKQVREAVGRQAEEYIARYTVQPWNQKSIFAVFDNLDQLNSTDRDFLLMRLVNELEDHLDLGMLYCGNAKKGQQFVYYGDVKESQSPTNCSGAVLVKMAEKLGFPSLATDLAQVLRESTLAEIPEQLHRPSSFSFTLAPKSYQRRLSVVFYRWLVQSFRRLRPAAKPKILET